METCDRKDPDVTGRCCCRFQAYDHVLNVAWQLVGRQFAKLTGKMWVKRRNQTARCFFGPFMAYTITYTTESHTICNLT